MQHPVPVPRSELPFIKSIGSNLITGMCCSSNTNGYCVKTVEAVRNRSLKVTNTGTHQTTDIITTSVNIIDCIAVRDTSRVAPDQTTDIISSEDICIFGITAHNLTTIITHQTAGVHITVNRAC